MNPTVTSIVVEVHQRPGAPTEFRAMGIQTSPFGEQVPVEEPLVIMSHLAAYVSSLCASMHAAAVEQSRVRTVDPPRIIIP